MSATTFDPKTQQTQNAPSKNEGCGKGQCGCGGTHHAPQPIDDGIRIMPTSDDLKKPSSDAQFIQQALAEEKSNHKNLIASSRQTVPHITVNGVQIDPTQIAQEVQYHPANSQEEAIYKAAQALVIKELLKQEIVSHPDLGKQAWDEDEERAIADLLTKQVQVQTPDQEVCKNYFEHNPQEFIAPPRVQARHILLACPPDAHEERLACIKKANEIIAKLNSSDNIDADFIQLAHQYSACPSKTDGGFLGVIHKGSTVLEFERAVFAAQKGIMASPIQTRYGVHVVQITDRTDGMPLDFASALLMIENRLKQQSFHHHLCDYLFLLSQKADISGITMQMNQENVYRG